MPSNPNRTIVTQIKRGFIRIDVYSTGLTHFMWESRNRLLLSIPRAQDLVDSGALERIADLLLDEETMVVQGHFSYGIKLDLDPTSVRLESVRYILDSKLSSLSKLVYFIALLSTRTPIRSEILEEVFTKMPDPYPAIEVIAKQTRRKMDDLVRSALYSGFVRPENSPNREESEYQRFSLLTAFLGARESVTYGEFMEEHADEFYIPTSYPLVFSSRVYRVVNTEIVNGLRPAEYTRFMEFFGSHVPSELRTWALKRFNNGVKTMRELRHKGDTSALPVRGSKSMLSWEPVTDLLTTEEAREFSDFLYPGEDTPKENHPAAMFAGVDNRVGPLIAYYFVEGGPDRLIELLIHVKNHMPESTHSSYYRPPLSAIWKNPYAGDDRRVPRFLPYVKVLQDPELKRVPLEWALAGF